ncbi:MAG: hypothetical protein JJE32_04100 [Deltaproteobacteria bacterium]|nr:hypothetical protein [Deltaproteobacteria bacterium]
MRNKKIRPAVLGFLAVAFLLAAFLAASHATERRNVDRSKLQIVSYASGLTGFFDAVSGKLYLYDANAQNCVAIRQLVEPGEPMKRLRN